MPFQNRVTPTGELIADPARGLVYGNRGCLHDADGRIRRRYSGRRWIACRLEFRGWRRSPLLQPGRVTELFFLDEATAFAAGHRPCALCRREDYGRFVELWRELHPRQTGADAIDAQLHSERLTPSRGQRRHDSVLEGLPDAAFVLHDGGPNLVLGAHLLRWTPAGYAGRRPRPGGAATLITPPSVVHVLRSGWHPVVPLLHSSALVRVENERVTLRPLRLDELDSSLEARRRQHAADVTTMPVVPSREALEERFRRSGVMRDRAIDLAIEAGGRRIGEIQTFASPGHDLPPGRFQVGIFLEPAERGRGYGTEATRLMLDWLFAECGAVRVDMPTAAGNVAMRSVLERLGFAPAGTIRELGHEFLGYAITRERRPGR